MTKKSQKLKSLFAVILGLCLGLFLCEWGLRFLRPQYAYQAQAMTQLDQQRFLVRPADSKTSYPHPDRDEKVAVFYDHYGLRVGSESRKRRFDDDQKLWGFFGDSFTENLRISYDDSFTARLEKSLDIDILNFGVEGYGTDQSYLHYKNFEHKNQLEKVVYLFHFNDLQDVLHNQLFSLEDGRPVSQLKNRVSFIKLFLGQFYLTYFVLDSYYQLKGRSLQPFFSSETKDEFIPLLAETESKKSYEKRKLVSWDMKEAMADENIELVQKLVQLWRDEVHAMNAEFFLVVLPDQKSDALAREVFKDQEDVLYSRAAFLDAFNDPSGQSWSFKNDYHWNEKAQEVFAQWVRPHLLSRYEL